MKADSNRNIDFNPFWGKGMNVIVCIDDRGGMLFNHRRQSSDKIVTEYIANMAKDSRLLVTPYTAKLFQESVVISSACPWEMAGEKDYCFVENLDISPVMKIAHRIILFRWNRVYPADLYFPLEELKNRKLVDRQEFAGNSHERITMEVYA